MILVPRSVFFLCPVAGIGFADLCCVIAQQSNNSRTKLDIFTAGDGRKTTFFRKSLTGE